MPTMRLAAARILTPIALIVVPIVSYVFLFQIAWTDNSFAIDFHNEIYPEAKELWHAMHASPSGNADLAYGSNHVWPPLVGYVAIPLTALSPSAADFVIALIGVACFGAALWTVGVRDWRVYGAASLWGPVINEMRTAHLTLILCLLVAILWRTRERTAIPGLVLGLAVALKIFLWPLALWLLSLRRWREAAIAAAAAAASLLLLLPFGGILPYARLLRRLGAEFDQDSYNPYGLLAQVGAPSAVARIVSLAIGLGILALAYRRRSFALSVAGALLLSPIVWLDYFALTAIPLAVVRPRFSWVWLLPILTFGMFSAGAGIGVTTNTIRVLIIFTVVVWYTQRLERGASVKPVSESRTPDQQTATANG